MDDVRLAKEGLEFDMGFAIVTWLGVAIVMRLGLANVKVLHWIRKPMNHDDVRQPRSLAKSIHRTQMSQVDAC